MLCEARDLTEDRWPPTLLRRSLLLTWLKYISTAFIEDSILKDRIIVLSL